MTIESISTNVAAPPISGAMGGAGAALRQAPAQTSSTAAQTRSAQTANTSSQTAQNVAQAQDRKPQSLSDTPLEDAVKKLTDFVSTLHSEISFSIDEASGTRVVKVLDSQSKEVIRQIPSEEAIQLAQALDKLQGLFVREKA